MVNLTDGMLHLSGSRSIYSVQKCPKQTDSINCGVFVCWFMTLFATDSLPLTFPPGASLNAPEYRGKMAEAFVRGNTSWRYVLFTSTVGRNGELTPESPRTAPEMDLDNEDEAQAGLLFKRKRTQAK